MCFYPTAHTCQLHAPPLHLPQSIHALHAISDYGPCAQDSSTAHHVYHVALCSHPEPLSRTIQIDFPLLCK
ncbi:hypothetical protein JI435_423180 [Parastagonospora nodorum SN15]|uniref:Uncharacterized protein n=1 Tax=Phaeosphaeria nodorum (strain SN15 / ATCC MYA-4574 / FGSC 10173) TaxID=321614 RepID=A0A7U2NQ22_PHANO|nr:hypothetical protein JI435_423180 [Parastagonospora nodorum SN15]